MSKIRNSLKKIIFNQNIDNKFFYGKYLGGIYIPFFKKFLIILFDLRSFMDYFFYHRNPLILYTVGKSKKLKRNFSLQENERQALSTLEKEGIVFLDGYFEEIVDQLVEDNILENEESSYSYIENNEIKQNEPLFQILNDKSLINIASKYYGVKSYYRYRPTANLTFPKRDDISSRQRFLNPDLDDGDFADEWHVDSIYNLQYHILLKDISKDETRMLFAKGDKVGFFDRYCGYASEEYVRDNYEIIELYGKKGTVILFDGSIHWHRLYPVKGVKRYTSSVLFTRGQQPCNPKMYKKRLNVDKLNSINREDSKYII